MKKKQTALQERISELMRTFYENDEKSAVIACFQEGKALNFIIQGKPDNLATALTQMLRTNDDFYRIVVEVAGRELASRVADVSKGKLVRSIEDVKS